MMMNYFKKSKFVFLKYFLIPVNFILFFLIFSCANQIPPSGGEDDKTPPKVKKITPKPNTIEFNGKSISIEFNKYVDRRSFRESFYISPKPATEPDFSWSGKEVEIKFQEPLKKNKTYSFIITKGFKDYLGNYLKEPVQFAVSTGDSIDNGSISGKVFTKNYNNIIIFAYSLNDKNDTLINPLKISPEYISQVNENGTFSFKHITRSNYRVFALKDINKNMVYDKGVDEISVLTNDIFMDTADNIHNVNFLFRDILPDERFIYSSAFINSFSTSDTARYIYSSPKNNEKEIPIEPRIFIHFTDNKISKYDIAGNIRLFDSTNNKFCKIVLNWTSDTLLEIFPVERLNYSSEFKITFDLRNTKRKYIYNLNFMTADEKRFGKITGTVVDKNLIPYPVYVKLIPKNNNIYIRSQTLNADSSFMFTNLIEGDYSLFAFIDSNNSGEYDAGDAYPFKPSEKFFIFEPSLKLKGNWSIDNISIRF